MSSLTAYSLPKEIREQLGALFSVNLNSLKAELNKIIDSILQA
jgi:hypothetical protein